MVENPGRWQSEDEAIAVSRTDTTEPAPKPICPVPGCGRELRHRGRHRGSTVNKAAPKAPAPAVERPAREPIVREPEIVARFYVPVSLEMLAALEAVSVEREDGCLVVRR